jgi:hypothetical protein
MPPSGRAAGLERPHPVRRDEIVERRCLAGTPTFACLCNRDPITVPAVPVLPAVPRAGVAHRTRAHRDACPTPGPPAAVRRQPDTSYGAARSQIAVTNTVVMIFVNAKLTARQTNGKRRVGIGTRHSDTPGIGSANPKSRKGPSRRYGFLIPSRALCVMSAIVARQAETALTKSETLSHPSGIAAMLSC